MSDNVFMIGKEVKFPAEAELHNRIHDIICEYNGEISLVAAIGILELEKIKLMNSQV